MSEVYARWKVTHKKRMTNPAYAAAHRKRRAAHERKLRRDPARAPAIRAAQNARHAADPRAYMLSQARIRAKIHGVPYALTFEDLVIPRKCPVLGLILQTGKGKVTATSPTIDRRIPALGYVPGNVTVMSHKANRIKNDATAEELFKVAAWLQSFNQTGDNCK